MTRKKIDNKFLDADEMVWLRYGILGWDSMTVKEKVVFNMHSMRLIGFTKEAFDMSSEL